MERRTDAEHHRALDLRPNGVRIDDSAAIDRAHDAPNANRAVIRHLDLGNVRHIGREDVLDGDAATDPLRQLLSPARLVGSERKHGLGSQVLLEQREPVGDRILPCRRRQLIHEAFGHEHIVRRADAAPERGGNTRRLHPDVLDMKIGKIVDEVDGTLGGVGIETIVEGGRCPSRDDRGSCKAIGPGDRHSLRIETGGQTIEPIGAVHVVLNVFLARPHDLHRPVDLLGDLDGSSSAIGFKSAAKATTDQMIVDDDLLERQACDLRGRRLNARQGLRPDPDLAAFLAHVNRAVHRLHRRMRQEGKLIARLDLGGSASHRPVDIADVLGNCTGLAGRLLELGDDQACLELGMRTIVPFDHQGLQPLLRRPHMVGNDRHGIIEPNDLAHPFDRLRGGIIHALDATPEHRRLDEGGDLHAGRSNVDAVGGRSIDLGRRVETLCRGAD